MGNAITSVDVPLHPGAVRYYDVAGIAIPDTLHPRSLIIFGWWFLPSRGIGFDLF